jgi:hypothetical protein
MTPAAITVTAATDKSEYRRGEALYFSITANNSDSVPVNLNFGSSVQTEYRVDGNYFYPQAGLTILTNRGIPANGSYTWTYRHNWLDNSEMPGDFSIGTHDFFGRVLGSNAGPTARPNGDSPTGTFAVIPNAPPPASLSLDFDHITPGATDKIASVSEFWPAGVRFYSKRNDADGGSNVPIGSFGGNQYVHEGYTTYPPGFNIIADFDGNYTNARADVAAAVGVSVTMIAKDASGNVIGTTTSAPMTALYDFVPLSISAAEPIKTLEWWPSNMQSGLEVDNLAVHTPEPGGLAFLFLATAAVVTSRRARG